MYTRRFHRLSEQEGAPVALSSADDGDGLPAVFTVVVGVEVPACDGVTTALNDGPAAAMAEGVVVFG